MSAATPSATATLSPDHTSKHGPVTQVSKLLRRRNKALLDHDKHGFLRSIDRAATGLRTDQATLYDNIRDVPLASWHSTVDPQSVSVHHSRGTDSWGYSMYTTYSFTGLPHQKAVRRQRIDVAQRADGWRITALTEVGTHVEPWDLGKTSAVRSGRVIVLGVDTSRKQLRAVRSLATAAVPKVDSVWTDHWAQGAVVEIAPSPSAVDKLSGGEDLDQFAAVAAGESDTDADGDVLHWDRVVINPKSWKRMDELGRRVVLTHELTHIATGSLGSVPTWIAEGFADYVGWKNTGVPARYVAQELAQEIRKDGPPQHLPDAADFHGDDVDDAYEEAWLAARYVVYRYGEHKLVQLYHELAAESGTSKADQNDALHKTLKVSRKSFTKSWSIYVKSQLD